MNSSWHLKGKVIGVVGWAHLIGIEDLWHKKTIQRMRNLSKKFKFKFKFN